MVSPVARTGRTSTNTTTFRSKQWLSLDGLLSRLQTTRHTRLNKGANVPLGLSKRQGTEFHCNCMCMLLYSRVAALFMAYEL